MGFKFSTTIVQLTGLAQSAAELGSKWVAKGLVSYYKHGGLNGAHSEVMRRSQFMQTREYGFNRDVADAMRNLKNRRVLSDFQMMLFYPIVKMQGVVDTITWLGAFERAVAEGKSEYQCIKYADLTIETSQSSGFMSSLSAIERGTTSENTRLNEWVKAGTIFYSYFNTKFNIARRKLQQTDFRKKSEVLQLGTDYLMLFWLEAALGEFILGRLPDLGGDDDELKAIKWNMNLIASNAMSGVPLLRETYSAYSGFNTGDATSRGLGDVSKALIAMSKVAENQFTDKETDWYDTTRALISGGNVVSPVKYPAGQINQIMRGIEKADKGDATPMDYLRYKK